MMKQGQLQGQSLISLMNVGPAEVNRIAQKIWELSKFSLSQFLQFLSLSCSQKQICLMLEQWNDYYQLGWALKMLQVELKKNQLTTFTNVLAMCCMQRNILLVNTYIFGVNKFLVYKGSQLMIYCRYAQDYKWLQFACEEDCSCSFRWHHLTAVSFSSTELCVTTNRIWNRKVFDFPIVWWNMMLIAQVRVMFDSQGQWSKSGEEQITTIVYIWKFFPHIVSRNHVLCYMMLRMGCSGLWTGCKSGSRRSFLHADNKWFGFWTGCESGSGRLFVHDTDNGLLWVLDSM